MKIAVRPGRRSGERTSRQNRHAARTAASGARLGRTRIAIEALTPAAADGASDSPRRQAAARPQNAAAGTSLMIDFAIATNAGLVARSQAAPRPMSVVATRRPITKVTQTSKPLVSGTIQK